LKTLESAIIEKMILHLLIIYPKHLDGGVTLEFVSNPAREMYAILLDLWANEFEISSEHILTHEMRRYVDDKILAAIYDTEYQENKFDYYCSQLQRHYLYQEIDENNKVIGEEIIKTERDLSKIQQANDSITKSLNIIASGKASPYLSISEMLADHEETLKKRALGQHQTSGEKNLDKLLGGRLQPGLMTLAANAGQGKSTVTQFWILMRLIKKLPTAAVNTELSKEGYLDNMLPGMMRGISYYDLTGGLDPDKEGGSDLNEILLSYQEVKERMESRKNFLMYPDAHSNMSQLKKFFLDCRREFELTDDKILFAVVDMLSMIKEFSDVSKGSRADNIEISMNELNSFCLDHNIFCIGTVHLKRRDKIVEIQREEDLSQFKPTQEAIKSSSAYVDRSRWVVGIYSPYKILHSHPCNPILRDLYLPITELHLIKDNYSNNDGMVVAFVLDLNTKQLSVYIPDEEETTPVDKVS
jgi:replicative DNA helicase